MHLLPCASQVQGGILNFEVLRPDGSVFSYKTFEREAAEAGFHVRTGAECNPGACYNYLGVQVSMCRVEVLAVLVSKSLHCKGAVLATAASLLHHFFWQQ